MEYYTATKKENATICNNMNESHQEKSIYYRVPFKERFLK